MNYHDRDELIGALLLDGFEMRVWTGAGESIVDYYDRGGRQVGRVAVRMLDDGGVEWTRFWLDDDVKGAGLFTRALRWAAKQPSSRIAAGVNEHGFYKDAGFVEKDGWLELRKTKAKAWLKEHG